MNYIKRFTDFCGGFSAFCAIVYAFGQFMSYEPSGDTGIIEKFKHFFFGNYPRNFNAYLVMITLLVVSVAVGCIFERFPFVSLSVSFLPFLWTLFMFASGWLYDRPMLYLILATVHMAGNIIYALSLDKADGKRRAFLCVNVAGGLFGALCLFVWRKLEKMKSLEFSEEELEEMSDIDLEIFEGLESESAKLLLIIGIALLVTVALSVILRDLYYVDVILCALPFLYSVKVFFTEELTVFGGLVFAATAIYFIFRVLLMLSEPMRKSKKKESFM